MKRFTVFYVFLFLLSSLSAQQNLMVSIPYSMGFEATGSDSTELADGLWVLNAGAQASQCNDQWMVGTAVRSDGRQSLYIVGDTTLTPLFGTAANLQFAYRDFQFPAGSYTLSFDWMNAGGANTALYVGFVAYNPNVAMGAYTYVTANANSGVMPTVLTNNNCSGALYGKDTWQSYTFAKNINVSAGSTSVYRVYVAWANKGGATNAGTVIGGCVDNIQIVDARAPRPSNIQILSIACDTVELSWTGVADSYTVQYRKVGTNTWMNATYDESTPNKALVEGLEEGSYMFRVRGESMDTLGNTLYSAYTYAEDEYLVYCEDNHCVTYFNLEGPNVVCTTGNFDKGNLSAAFDLVGMVNYGAESQHSRHTVNWDKTATDPRTNNQLLLVPSNAMASVRLGNWQWGAECEGITYSIFVDQADSVLLMRYAIVLEDPGHEYSVQPRFIVQLTDEQGIQIDSGYGYHEFVPDSTRLYWHSENNGTIWKDWSTIELNVSDYVGQTIHMRLATYDCSQGGHYGYAYFTLDCIQRASSEEEDGNTGTYGIGSNKNNWTPTKTPMTVSDGMATCTIALDTTEFEFSVVENRTWLKNTTTIITREHNSVILEAENNMRNTLLHPDIAGDYVFNYSIATKTLVVLFPTQEMGTDEVNITEEYIKILRNGQVLIVRHGKFFNIMGQPMF